ncbi:MAG TPA: YkgJ family cysteine cluster protein [Phototrophicaceae bacterium]|nr:YkgJ family cysteine cluster protein [Phototrophicaceae bacterium]
MVLTDLDEVRRRAEQRRGEFELLAYSMQRRPKINDAKLDAYVEEIAAPIIAAIDCKQCANCCHNLNVYLLPEDAQRLSDGLMIPLEEVETRYIEHAEAEKVDEWGKFRTRPCVFLSGKLCSIYEHRPGACRTYPAFTPDFRWTIADTIEGASICPIIYNVLSTLCDQLLKPSKQPPPKSSLEK